ncbi:RDD family protein [Streptomyces sp. DSM 44915]|uniref:RDD family protein n=1 Tax=Streptomyces chisholmiae TaxID=3075540 RepID=A0ABU2JSA2_9ACTN|nr:RDD family protein [Streptomyces sp. DSM 44915]MDT0267872.1 RDD family protein [Streptomyces sp. DSM 44915]
MSLPPAGNASGGPGPNWYPDPSIPGYIRYWDGQTWVAGSSRPEPREGEPLPTPPSAAAAPATPPATPPAQDGGDGRAALPVRENRAEIAASRDQRGGSWRPDEDASTSPVAAAGRVDPRGQFLRAPSEGSEPPAVPRQAAAPAADAEPRDERTFGSRQADPPQQPAAAAGPPGLGLPGQPKPADAGAPPSVPDAAAPAAGSAPQPQPLAPTAPQTAPQTAPAAASQPPAAGPPGLGLPGAAGQAAAPAAAPRQPAQPAVPAQQPPAQAGPQAPGPAAGPPGLGLPGAPAQAAQASAPTAPQAQPGQPGQHPGPLGQQPGQQAPPGQGGFGAQPPAAGTPQPGQGFPPAAGGPGGQPSPAQGVPQPGQLFPPQAGGPQGGGYGFPPPAAGAPQGGGYGFPPPAGGPQGGPPQGGGYGYPPPAAGGPQGGGYGYPQQQSPQAAQSAYLQSHEGSPLTMMAKFSGPEQKYPATSGRRLFARIIDSLLPLGGAIALAVPLLGDARDHLSDRVDAIEHAGVNETVWLIDGTTGGYLAMVLGVFFGVGLLFEVLPVALWGTTPGKAMLGLKVLDMESQEAPSFGRAIVRWLVYNSLSLVLVGIVNMILATRDQPWRQGWHDKAARTFVAGRGQPADPVGPAQ